MTQQQSDATPDPQEDQPAKPNSLTESEIAQKVSYITDAGATWFNTKERSDRLMVAIKAWVEGRGPNPFCF